MNYIKEMLEQAAKETVTKIDQVIDDYNCCSHKRLHRLDNPADNSFGIFECSSCQKRLIIEVYGVDKFSTSSYENHTVGYRVEAYVEEIK